MIIIQKNNTKALFVEFIGVGGVGKSTLLNEIILQLETKGIPFDNLFYKKKAISLSDAFSIINLLFTSLMIKPKTIFGFKKTLKLLAHYQLSCKLASKEKNVHIIDEGIFQKIRAIKLQSNKKNLYNLSSNILRSVQIPDIVVVVEASAEKIFQRRTLRVRESDSFTYQKVQEEVIDLHNVVKTIDEVKSVMKSKLIVIRINNEYDQNIKKNAEKVVNVLENLQQFRDS